MNLIPRPKACLLGVGPVAALLAGILLVGPPSCGRAAEDPGRWVTVLHTNDIHGTYRSTPASWIDGNPKIGGFPAESDYVRRERAAAERSLLLDAGDFMTGNPISDLDYEGVPGGGMVAFLNLLGYDALCLGNHDFDHGRAVTKELVGMARMPVLVANLFDESGALFTGKGYQVFPLGGMKVAVIGLVMEDLPGFLRPGAAEGLRVRNPLESVLEILDEVDARSDLIVLLTHLGVDEDRALATALGNRVDVIVGGHSHTRLDEPERQSGVLICQTGSNDRYLGRLDVLVRGDSVADFRGRLIPMWESEAVPDPAVEALARTFDARIDSLYGQVLADLRTDWFTSSRGESNLGSWITDRLREAAGADVAVMNSGGIRKSLPKGPITILDVKEVLPFDNVLERFECTGEDLLALARSNAQGQAGGEEGVVQISGLRYRWRRSASGEAVVEAVEVGGKPVEKARTYLVAGPDYTLAHYDRFLGFEPKGVRSLGVTVTEIVIDAVREAGVIESGVDGRMEEIR